jgi:hypothetical protein
MTPQRKHGGGPPVENAAARSADRERARQELDRKLDEALECTFPASDPFHLSIFDKPSRAASDARPARRSGSSREKQPK